MIKIVTIFLIAMMILAIFGRLRMPRLPGARKLTKLPRVRKCKACGAPIPGKGPCVCEKQD
ncbi:hypothetical protein HMH01_04340 [Halovulum dunhuangense]|uniref:Uncharacterized protein n=1 Tax=Halovulum dunhuangense TaxID=1505036 RepID=A0A849KZU4_9RHOB|nr:hypothetical protein [Halovulum dunhuangense]NNU79664.1 hypothetical protein [Halovulum dunhuangense]